MIIPDALKLFFRRLGCAEMNELFTFMFIEIAVYLILIFQRQIRTGDEMDIVIFSSALERSFEQLILASDHVESAPSYMDTRDELNAGVLQNALDPADIEL